MSTSSVPASPARSAKEQFDRQATHYNAQWNQWSEESLRWLLEHANLQPTDTLLDIATGTGFTALAFAPHVASVVGLDVSSGMLAQATERAREQGLANVTFVEGAAEAIPFGDSAFTLVTCRIAPHHFLSVPKFVAEAARVLSPGGRFLLADTSVPDNAPEVDAWQNEVEALRDPSHVRNYTPREWERFVALAGLTFIEMTSASGQVRLTLNDWLLKAGCAGAQAEEVRRRFANASSTIAAAFQIEALPDGDTAFAWHRIVLAARKP